MSDTPELAGGEQNLRVNLREGLFQAGGEQLEAQGAGRGSTRACTSIRTARDGGFPGGLVAQTLPSNAGGMGLNPG